MISKDSKNHGTATSSFGVSSRRNHDSSVFYNSNLYNGKRVDDKKIDFVENEIPKENINRVFCKSSENMEELPDNSVHLMVTSPPYNACKDYDEDLTLNEYLSLLENVFEETYRVLVTGGRACINIANLGRKPYLPLHSHVIQIMENIGFLMRGEIIWDKNIGGGTAWGSWQSAANPVLRDQHEYILVFCKNTFSRKDSRKKENTITKDEFLEFTKSIWTFSPESAKKIGHPAPFPEELPYRCIQLFSFKDDVILDPFLGSGTTAISALKSERKYVAYDNNKEYVEDARKRIEKYMNQKSLDEY